MTTIFEAFYRCPECGTAFQGTTIGSCGHAAKWSDLCPDFWGANPRGYFIACCPSCGNCDFSGEFGNVEGSFESGKLDLDPGGDIFERYKKAYEQALKKKKTARDLADYAIQVAWCRHDEEEDNDTPELEKFRKAAVFHFEDALADGQMQEKELPTIHYLTAELSRQNGDFEKAKKHLDEIPADTEIASIVPECREHADKGDSSPFRLGEDEE
ncbi:MAG: DUF2225 domain-containing protein [Planctomycetota bacterium]|jgi:uncharacterized protein (DUF2225 family)